MIEKVKADLFRYQGLKGKRGFIKGLSYPGFRYTYILRKLENSRKYSLIYFLFGFLKQKYQYKYGFQIPLRTQIGEGLFMGHYGTIIINEKTIIGKNCNIGHLVTIGQVNRGKYKGCPTIGDNVWIGTGAVIVGEIFIGSNVLIAPNSFVNINVPSSSIVIGNPCQIISKEKPCEGYINYILG